MKMHVQYIMNLIRLKSKSNLLPFAILLVLPDCRVYICKERRSGATFPFLPLLAFQGTKLYRDYGWDGWGARKTIYIPLKRGRIVKKHKKINLLWWPCKHIFLPFFSQRELLLRYYRRVTNPVQTG